MSDISKETKLKRRQTFVNNVIAINNCVRLSACFDVCMYVCMVITYSRVWINRVRLPILLVVS